MKHALRNISLANLPSSIQDRFNENKILRRTNLKRSNSTISVVSQLIRKKKDLNKNSDYPGWYYWDKLRIRLKSRNLYTSNISNNKIIKLDNDNDSNKDDVKSLIKDTIYDCIINDYKICIEKNFWQKLLYALYVFKGYWDFVICLIITYTLIILPFRLAFNIYDSSFNALELIFDIILFVDIFYELRININKMLTFKDVMEVKLKDILPLEKNLVKMIIKIFLCIPFEYINYDLNHIKMIRMIYLNRIIKSFTPIMNYFYIKKTRFNNEIRGIIRLIRILLIFIYIAHIFACYWIDINIENHDINWFYIYSGDNNMPHNHLDIYINSMYFVITTFSTVGYGDIKGKQIREYTFQMAEMFCGIVLYAFLFNEVTYAMKQFNMAETKSASKTDEIYFTLMRLNKSVDSKIFPKSLWSKSYTILCYNTKSKIEDLFLNNKHYQTLSPSMQKELLRRAYSNILQTFSWYFDDLSDDFVHEFLLRLTPHHFKYGKKLLKCNGKANKLYFIMNGRIFAKSKGSCEPTGYLKKGDILGDHMIFLDSVTEYSYRVNYNKSILCFIMDEQMIYDFEKRYKKDIMQIKKRIYQRLSIRGEFRYLNRKLVKTKSMIDEYNQIVEENEKKKRLKLQKRAIMNRKMSYAKFKATEGLLKNQLVLIGQSNYKLSQQYDTAISMTMPKPTNIPMSTSTIIHAPTIIQTPTVMPTPETIEAENNHERLLEHGKSKFLLPPIIPTKQQDNFKNFGFVNQDDTEEAMTKRELLSHSPKPIMSGRSSIDQDSEYGNEKKLLISPLIIPSKYKRRNIEENKGYVEFECESAWNKSYVTDIDYEMESKKLLLESLKSRFPSAYSTEVFNDDYYLHFNKDSPTRLQKTSIIGSRSENQNDRTNEISLERVDQIQLENSWKIQGNSEFPSPLIKKKSPKMKLKLNNYNHYDESQDAEQEIGSKSPQSNNWLQPMMKNDILTKKKSQSFSPKASSFFSMESLALPTDPDKDEPLNSINEDYIELHENLELPEEQEEENNEKCIFYGNDELDNSIDLDIKAMDIYAFQELTSRIEYLTHKLDFLKRQFLLIKMEKLAEIENAEIFIKRKLKYLANF